MTEQEIPSGWELQRSVEALRRDVKESMTHLGARMDKMVPTGEYLGYQQRIEERLRDLADRIAAEATGRQAAEARLRADIEALVTRQRWVAAAIVIPIALFLANLYLLGGR